jgi:hypothetical protein
MLMSQNYTQKNLTPAPLMPARPRGQLKTKGAFGLIPVLFRSLLAPAEDRITKTNDAAKNFY